MATDGILRAIDFSEEKIAELRGVLAAALPPSSLVVTCGSYARREASETSDMDYYSIATDLCDKSKQGEVDEIIVNAIKNSIGIMPADQGAFATNIDRADLLNNYGGSLDSNLTITRRMLYILEGEYLTCEDEFRRLRREIIERYVNHTPHDYQLAFYLLNDIVRYWRTLAVDYANKTFGDGKRKPWAVRNIKLVFSRKLIYASGIFSVGVTADRTQSEKVDILESLFNKTPLDRMKTVCGEASVARLTEMYDFFLDRISKKELRDHLDGLSPDESRGDQQFRELKNMGHHFSRELMSLLSTTFHSSHPIHMGVIF